MCTSVIHGRWGCNTLKRHLSNLADQYPKEAGILGKGKAAANRANAEVVGKAIAERLIAKKTEAVVFDRGGYIYHGKVKALADAARQGGLKF